MKSLAVAIALCFLSMNVFASDYGWRHLNFTSNGVDQFSLDISLNTNPYTNNTVFKSAVWIHVNDSLVTEAKAVIINYLEGNPEPLSVKEVKLVHNISSGVFEAPVEFEVSAYQVTRYHGSKLIPTRQEIAIVLNGNQWLKNNDNQSNFRFNILETFAIRN